MHLIEGKLHSKTLCAESRIWAPLKKRHEKNDVVIWLVRDKTWPWCATVIATMFNPGGAYQKRNGVVLQDAATGAPPVLAKQMYEVTWCYPAFFPFRMGGLNYWASSSPLHKQPWLATACLQRVRSEIIIKIKVLFISLIHSLVTSFFFTVYLVFSSSLSQTFSDWLTGTYHDTCSITYSARIGSCHVFYSYVLVVFSAPTCSIREEVTTAHNQRTGGPEVTLCCPHFLFQMEFNYWAFASSSPGNDSAAKG